MPLSLHTTAAVRSVLPLVAIAPPSLVTPTTYAINNNSHHSQPWPNFNLETGNWARSSNGPEVWHPDTSATHHFSPHLSNFSSYDPAKSSDLVHLADRSSQPVQNFGHGKIYSNNNSFHLNDIMHTLSINESFLSLDNNSYFVFFHFHFVVKD